MKQREEGPSCEKEKKKDTRSDNKEVTEDPSPSVKNDNP